MDFFGEFVEKGYTFRAYIPESSKEKLCLKLKIYKYNRS
jgi:hypothetical protein